MNKLSLVKTEMFGNSQCDIYQRDKNSFCMTSEQLGRSLGYVDPQKAISNIVSRNQYLGNNEFSSLLKLRDQVQARETRIFTEDGIYEVTMLSRTPKAIEFRRWIRSILKSLHDGTLKTVSPHTILNRHLNTVKELSKGLSKEQQINLRIIAVRNAGEESNTDYSDILAVLNPSAPALINTDIDGIDKLMKYISKYHKAGKIYQGYRWIEASKFKDILHRLKLVYVHVMRELNSLELIKASSDNKGKRHYTLRSPVVVGDRSNYYVAIVVSQA